MKFRTDFVTNSSSSSFFNCWINFTDSDTFELYDEWDQSDDTVSENLSNLMVWFGISATDCLLACLYFSRMLETEIENSLVPVLTPVFQFLADKKPFPELVNEIRTYLTELHHEHEWAEGPEMEELLNLDPDEYDHDELIDKVLELFGDMLGAELSLDDLIDLSHENRPLSDVISVTLQKKEQHWKHAYEYYYEELEKEFGEEKAKSLHQMSEDEPLYTKEKNKWDYLVNRFVYQNTRGKILDYLLTINIDSALQWGELYRSIAQVTYETEEEWFIVDEPDKTLTVTEEWKKRIENDGEFHDNVQYEKIESVILPDGLKRIGRETFRDWSELRFVNIPESVTEIGAFVFDGCRNLPLPQFPTSIQKIGLTCRKDILQYAIDNNLIQDIPTDDFLKVLNDSDLEVLQILHTSRLIPQDIPEKDLYFALYDCIDYEDLPMMQFLFETGIIPKHFSEYPVTDLLAMAIELEDKDYLDLLLNNGLELDYSDVAQYICDDRLDMLYPLCDKGLLIQASAYEDLVTLTTKHGKPEYTAWLLNRKNEDAQTTGAIE